MVNYLALALQTRCVAVNGLSIGDARLAIDGGVTRIVNQIEAARALLGPRLRLVVLPEYALTGFPMGEGIAEWRAKAAIALDGPEVARLMDCAIGAGIHLAVNAYEAESIFPGLYFQCCFVIAPSGTIVLRYRRLISMFAPSPIDVLDRYRDHYGDELFPIAETEIGVLAAIASEEILYPEIARIVAMRGAEVLLHSSGEMASPLPTPKAICRRARAVENLAFVVSANAASLESGNIAEATTDGGSEIVDYRGQILARAGQGETIVAHAEIDLAPLRRARTTVGMGAMLARVPAGAAADAYARLDTHPINGLLDQRGEVVVPDRAYFQQRQQNVIAQLQAAHRLIPTPGVGE